MKKVRYQVRIGDLPQHTRPRERLLSDGASALADRELLAIVLRTGTARSSALGLADEVLAKFGDLRRLAQASAEELIQLEDKPKAAQILTMELGRRAQTPGSSLGSRDFRPRCIPPPRRWQTTTGSIRSRF